MWGRPPGPCRIGGATGMTRRRLRPDELTLWQEVARKTTPLSSNRKLPATSFTDQPAQQARPPGQEPETPPKFEIGQTARDRNGGHDVLPPLPERLQQAPVSMDKKAFQRLKKGKLVPEAKLDLHGMTLDQAHPALNGFILRSHAAGRRLVLIRSEEHTSELQSLRRISYAV